MINAQAGKEKFLVILINMVFVKATDEANKLDTIGDH
jgi:hypothetical protein